MNENQDDILEIPNDADARSTAENKDHDQIIAHFQEITNFYEMEQCQAILESTQWNLDQAIQSFFNGGGIQQMEQDNDIQEIESRPSAVLSSAPVFEGSSSFSIENIMSGPLNHQGLFATGTSINPQTSTSFTNTYESMFSAVNDDLDGPSVHSKPNRLLNFHIEYFQKKFTLHMPDNETILSLKKLIEQEIDLPPENQKLKGWKNKDARVTDGMLIRELNLPLENNMFVINTSNKDFQSKSTGVENSSKIESFELNIRVIKNKPTSQVTIVNNSKSAEATSLAMHLATETFKESTEKKINNYHLHFDPNMKFIEIKRKINILTSVNVNEQEWWLYLLDLDKDDINEFQEISLEDQIENGIIFSMPLTVLIENNMKLVDLKALLDNLTETNTKVSTSSSNSLSNLTPASVSDGTKNSKLTATTNQANIIRMSFLVTQKKTSGSNGSLPTSSVQVLPGKSNIETEEILEEDDLNCDLSVDDDDIDDNFIMDSTPKQKALIPADCPVGDELLGTTMFIEEFFKRYQPIVPIFYNGLLENAIKEAVLCSAKNRKLLGIYLHSDNSVCRHIFCSKTLCDENVVNFLTANFVVWPWDLTNKEHEAHFYTSCSKYLGSVVTSHLKTNKIEFPAFLIVNRTRGTNEVIAVIEGTASHETMMHRLMQAYEMFEAQRVTDVRDETERDEREQIKRDQDAAYQESLELDKAKRQKQDEEQERLRQLAKQEEDLEKQRIENRQKKMKECEEKLPKEPSDGEPLNKIARIRFRLPNGEMLQRKFFIENSLQNVFDFLTSKEYFTDEYKVLSSWPRRDLTNEESERTLQDLKLFPQETLTLEER